MTVNLALVSGNSFLRLAIDTILRDGDCRIHAVETIAALSTLNAAVDLVLFDTHLLGAAQPHAGFTAIVPPILALDTCGLPLGPVGSARFAAVLSVCDAGRLDLAALRRDLPGAIAANLPTASVPGSSGRSQFSPPRPERLAPRDLLLVGASTGGPEALIVFLAALGPPAVPVVVALHMPSDQTAVFSAHLAARTGLRVIEAAQGAVPPAGSIALLKGGANYRIEQGSSGPVLRRSLADAGPYRPSINMLFGSAADAGLMCDVVVLSGMGDDGAEGAARIEAAGGCVLVQRPDCCVVAGMPTATLAACRTAQALTPASIAARLARNVFAAAASPSASHGSA